MAEFPRVAIECMAEAEMASACKPFVLAYNIRQCLTEIDRLTADLATITAERDALKSEAERLKERGAKAVDAVNAIHKYLHHADECQGCGGGLRCIDGDAYLITGCGKIEAVLAENT